METLYFTYNWNHKLDCDNFTTIRLFNDKRYYVGARYEIILRQGSRQVNKGPAEIMAVKHILLAELDEFAARLDTGYSLLQTREIIKTIYKNYSPTVDWRCQLLSVSLFTKIKQDNQQKLGL
jgi:hypothetical protein